MNNQQTASTILALEECIEQYIADCRSRVDGFVDRHFSLQETIALQKQSLVSDLLCHPINALWSIPSLFVKKLIEIPVKIGWRSGANLITRLPTGIKTRYQIEIERLIATELLEWPRTMSDRQASSNGLLERIKQHEQLGPLLASGALSYDVLKELSDIPHLMAEHVASRALVFDATATVLTLLTGWLFFGDHSLGIRNRRSDRQKQGQGPGGLYVHVRIQSRIGLLFRVSPEAILLANRGRHSHRGAFRDGHEPTCRHAERSLAETDGVPTHTTEYADRRRGRPLAPTITKAPQARPQTTHGMSTERLRQPAHGVLSRNGIAPASDPSTPSYA